MDAESFYTLNSLNNVQLKKEDHGLYPLNEIILELSHFLDPEVVEKVEIEMFRKKLCDEWDLDSSFKFAESRNKEIGIVLNELEEV